MNEAEKQMIANLLGDYAGLVNRKGCDQITLPNTPENRSVVDAANHWYWADECDGGPPPEPIHPTDVEIATQESLLALYMIERWKNVTGCVPKELG